MEVMSSDWDILSPHINLLKSLFKTKFNFSLLHKVFLDSPQSEGLDLSSNLLGTLSVPLFLIPCMVAIYMCIICPLHREDYKLHEGRSVEL